MNADQISKLSDEEKRVKIAKACGWTRISSIKLYGRKIPIGDHASLREDKRCYPGKRAEEWLAPIPDYLNSLDTMAEVERTLTLNQGVEYALRLMNTAAPGGATPFELATATAVQRATAFLMVKEGAK